MTIKVDKICIARRGVLQHIFDICCPDLSGGTDLGWFRALVSVLHQQHDPSLDDRLWPVRDSYVLSLVHTFTVLDDKVNPLFCIILE